MIYSDPEFLILFLVTLLGFYAIPHYKFRFFLLTTASLFFYAWTGILDTLIFASVIIFSWIMTWLAKTYPQYKKTFLITGIVVMSCHLFFWKYAPWLNREIQAIWPHFLNGRELSVPLPVGISFFTLQGIAYMVDFSRNEVSFIGFREYLLFKSFFPQLVAGPIVRVPQLMPQLKKLRSATDSEITLGLYLFCQGFFKKLVIADRSSVYVDTVFHDISLFNRYTLLKALLGYTVQIWADFSGYTDMGRGAAKLLGIHLPENFLSPYLSLSPSEFWRRWHVTLSEWIRDYIYIPMGGSRGALGKVLSVAITTMVISGLWHGANWTFVLWGFYHGMLLGSERLLKSWKSRISWNPALPRFVVKTSHWILMFSLVVFGWLIFRCQSVHSIGEFVRGVIFNTGTQGEPNYGANVTVGVILCFALQIAWYWNFATAKLSVVGWVKEKIDFGGFLNKPVFAGLLYGSFLSAIFLGSLFMIFGNRAKSFIYFQF